MGYQAPELILKQKYNEKIESFSMGVLLYNLITGKMPFASKYALKIDELTLKKEPTFKDKAWKQCSPAAQ